jgi:hypothetical protein
MKSLTFRIMAGVLLVGAAGAVISMQADWIKTKSKEGSVTLQTPPTWYVADDSDPEYIKRVEEVRKNNPKLGAMMSGGGSTDKNQILRMMDGADDGTDGYLDNFNLVKRPAGGLTEKYFKEVGDEILKQMPFRKKGEYKIIDTPLGKALSYWGTMDIALADKSKLGVDLLGYMLVKNDNLYVFSFGASEGNMKNRKETYEKILKSAKL